MRFLPLIYYLLIFSINLSCNQAEYDTSKQNKRFYFLEPAKTDHLPEFNLITDEISWFRIWYNSGTLDNEFGDEYGYYAASGNSKEMKACGVYSKINNILEYLNGVKFDSIDHKMMNSYSDGEAEYIRVRLKFDKGIYSKLGEFQILHIISEENGILEKNINYIIIIHSKSTRYFINKNAHLDLTKLLNELTYTDHGECLEFRTY